MKHRRCGPLRPAGILMLAALLAGGVSAQQAPAPTFEVQTRLALIDIQVTERGTGRVISNLAQRDFEILDAGKPVDVVAFEKESLPLDAVFVLDVTGPVPRTSMPQFEYPTALQQFATALRYDDRVAVVAASDKDVEVLSKLTTDASEIRNAIGTAVERRHRGRGGRALIYDALSQAAPLFGPRDKMLRRRTAFVITANREMVNQAKEDRVLTALLEADVTINGVVVPQLRLSKRRFPIGFGVPGISTGQRTPDYDPTPGPNPPRGRSTQHPEPAEPDEESLDPIALQTGGELMRFTSQQWVDWNDAVEKLRMRYMAAFKPPAEAKSGERRNVRVRLTQAAARQCGDCVVRARTRYIVP